MRVPASLPALFCLVALGCQQAAPIPTDPEGIPELAATGVELADWQVQDGWALAEPIVLPATRIGALVVLRAPGSMPRIEARGVFSNGSATPWTELVPSFEEPDQRVANLELGDVVARAELRIAVADIDSVAMLTWTALVPPPALPLIEPSRDGVSVAPLRGDLAAIGVRDRSSWGARATRCTDRDPAKYRIAIHHTVTPSGGDIGARLRGIQAYHMDTQGWCDIGYHFLVSLDGTLWEGRDLDLLGTHVGSNNTGNVGICFIGCFHSSGCSDWTPFTPPDGMVEAGGRLAGAIADIYDIDVNAQLRGHRDHAGATTSCPGDHLHARLGRIREIAGSGATGPRFRATYVAQSFPLASTPFELAPGAVVAGTLDLRNEGTEPWTPGSTFLGTTEPRDVASPLAGPDWISPNRAATVASVTMPGEVGRFAFSVRAPAAPGVYPQYFNLLQEGVAWFSDPGQGGPVDGQIQIRLTVLDLPPADAGVPDHDAGGSVADAGPRIDTGTPDDAGDDAGDDEATMMRGTTGCGCSAPAPSRAPAPVLAALTLLGLALRRRAAR